MDDNDEQACLDTPGWSLIPLWEPVIIIRSSFLGSRRSIVCDKVVVGVVGQLEHGKTLLYAVVYARGQSQKSQLRYEPSSVVQLEDYGIWLIRRGCCWSCVVWQ